MLSLTEYYSSGIVGQRRQIPAPLAHHAFSLQEHDTYHCSFVRHCKIWLQWTRVKNHGGNRQYRGNMPRVTHGTPRLWDSGNLNRITQITFLCVTARNIIEEYATIVTNTCFCSPVGQVTYLKELVWQLTVVHTECRHRNVICCYLVHK
jgi:hypothetical protein